MQHNCYHQADDCNPATDLLQIVHNLWLCRICMLLEYSSKKHAVDNIFHSLKHKILKQKAIFRQLREFRWLLIPMQRSVINPLISWSLRISSEFTVNVNWNEHIKATSSTGTRTTTTYFIGVLQSSNGHCIECERRASERELAGGLMKVIWVHEILSVYEIQET